MILKTSLLTLAVLAVCAALPAWSGESSSASARREAARLAALKAEEATRSAAGATTATGSGPAQPAAAAKPPAVDEKHVEIVAAGEVKLHGAGDLVGNRYLLQEIDGEAVAEDSDAFVEWRSGTSMGGKLCNVFRATCSFENTVVKAEELPAMTKMVCADEAMGALEKRLFPALKLGMSFLAVGDSLELRRDDLVLRFALDREEADEPEKETEALPAKDDAEEEETSAEDPAEEEVEPASDEPIVSEYIVVEEDLIDRKFILSKVDGEDFAVASGRQPFIEFGEGMRVGGSACNTFTGLGALAEGRLIVANAVATRMMCLDAKVNEFERDFHKMLREGVELVVDGETLLLTGGGRMLEFVEEK